jgi:alpha-L-fucosidase
VRSIANLVGLYFTSVGRNSKLLLNVPPTREGLLHETDVERLIGMREMLEMIFRENLAGGASPGWRATGSRTAVAELDLGRVVRAGLADVRENVERGQIVAQYLLEGSDGGEWSVLSRGTTIGYRKLDRFTPVPVRRVRLTIEDAVAQPNPVTIGLYAGF